MKKTINKSPEASMQDAALPWPFRNFAALKIFFTSLIFSLIVFSYSMIKAVKDSVFLSMVGTAYQPWAKILVILTSIVIFMPIYSFIMGRMRRQTLATIFPVIYGIFFIVFGLFLIHPTIGLANKISSPARLLGWISYIFLEFYSIAVVATFWAMLSSISTPDSSKRQYGIITIASRVAGIIASITGIYLSKVAKISANTAFPLILVGSACSLFGAAMLIQLMFRILPTKYLTGYTDLHEKAKLSEKDLKKKPHFLEGLFTIIAEPYAIGIFGLIASVEIISTIMDYRMQCLIHAGAGGSAMGMLNHFFMYTLAFQIAGLLLATFATTTLPKKIGIRNCLLITPIVLMLLITLSFGFNTLSMVMAVQIALRALNYGFNEPVREMLFVPTSREIQFVAKGWIDTFGKTLSKGSGAALNLWATGLSAGLNNIVSITSSLTVGFAWLIIAVFVGKKYHDAVVQDKVIGSKVKND